MHLMHPKLRCLKVAVKFILTSEVDCVNRDPLRKNTDEICGWIVIVKSGMKCRITVNPHM